MAENDAGDPDFLGPYRVIRRLGAGGMGTVYLAEPPVGRRVAIKVLHPETASTSTARARFAREVAAVRMVSSPYVVSIIDDDVSATVPWLAMEYVNGPSLSRAVAELFPLPASAILVLAAGLAEALGVVHATGFVHRDVKPSNVLLSSLRPMLTDFGIVSFARVRPMVGGSVAGTPAFMSPEQVTGDQVGPPSDIFSLGAVLAFAASGEPPFGRVETPAAMYTALSERQRPQLDKVPSGLVDLVERCMDADPARRPEARAVSDFIQPLLNSEAPLVYSRYVNSFAIATENAEARWQAQRREERALATGTGPTTIWTLPPRSKLIPGRHLSESRQSQSLTSRDFFTVPPAASPGRAAPEPAPLTIPPLDVAQTSSASPSAPFRERFPTVDVPAAPVGIQGVGASSTPEPFEAVDTTARYLKGQCPDNVRVGEPFSVLVSIVRQTTGGVPLKSLHVGYRGQDVLLVLHAPGLQVLTGQRQVLHVPFASDSEPVMFELQANVPGPCQLSVSAWVSGTFLGDLTIETTASRHRQRRDGHRDFIADVETTAVEGAVSLVVRYDSAQNSYRFEFRDADNPAEVTCHLAYQPGPLIEQLVVGLDRVSKGRTGYTASETRDYLREEGIGLWSELLPRQLREQFWERQDRISQLTILSDNDAVPWELLYPLDPGNDQGFLVEQFPVTRIVFGRRPSRFLSLAPARFVLPNSSPQRAREEIEALTDLLRRRKAAAEDITLADPLPVISELTPLLNLIRGGEFGLLHFACHNAFDPAGGSAISLDKRQFTPKHLNSAVVERLLARTAPTVFINACRSAGSNPTYNQLDGWARKFLEAGAAAFIGSLWAVRDTTARDFAGNLYRELQSGAALGEAVQRARLAAASEPGDPTWLAYAVYGDPRATLR